MSDNKQHCETDIVINSELQSSVATYLRCSGIFNVHFTTIFLPRLPVKN